MKSEDLLSQMFQCIDNKDTDGFVDFLVDNVLFRFGNADPVCGKATVADVLRGFFDSIKGLSHDLIGTWIEQDAVICHGTVTYTRHDSSRLCVPFANILRTSGDLIEEYLIFVDVSALYGEA